MSNVIVQTDISGANDPININNDRVFNFILNSSYFLSEGLFEIKRGSSSTNGITAEIYDNLNATGSVVQSEFVSSSSITQLFSPISFVFGSSLNSGSYSLRLSSTTSEGGSSNYFIKSGNLQIVDENTSEVITTFDADGNTTSETRILVYDVSNSNSYSGTGSTLTDLMGNSNATLNNGIVYVEGNCGDNYLELDGVNDYIITNVDLNPSLNPSNTSTIISVFTWVYPMEDGVIVSEHGSAITPDSNWHDSQIEIVSGNACFSVWPYELGTPKIISSIPTPLNQWHYLGFTYNGTTLTAYVNGQPAGSSSYSRITPYNYSSEPLHYAIGYGTSTNMAGTGNFAKMRLGTFEVYNTALDPTEILNKYSTSSLIWLCDSGGDGVINKYFGNKRNYGHYKLTRGLRKRFWQNFFLHTRYRN
jgi:hypothetical protein